MVLFVSDMHFGRFDRPTTRAHERALIDCLSAQAADATHLYLVGDVFDAYIEYRHLVPKGCVRFWGFLADWVDAGRAATYLLGNHDPWHRSYLTEELGVRLVPNALTAHHARHAVYVAHGDAVAAGHGNLARRVRPVLRHPWAVAAYRTLLPADWGMGLARWVSRRLHRAPEPAVTQALRAHAEAELRTHDAVVMGHSHTPLTHTHNGGTYVNLGAWYESQTFARLDADGLALFRWTDAGARPWPTTT
ncbi:UDP-2,3-diacylglucosamine diphosphatase [Salisaeta longa]|uniref:UDP-2,3-diacylglucosamine diphosphatase n=1 Tax=Salisaeta longa TaxID=503170 RepID=UPI0006868378|nr:UDP-2,3-diacylglucosamine diphosphatase [Salisaeta longa]